MVGNHGPVAELDEWLGKGESERTKTGAEAADKD